jgi:hypothetical protein
MAKNSTWEDVPNILNSICWQLKCIAETLDSINQREKEQEPKLDPQPVSSSKLRSMLNDIRS